VSCSRVIFSFCHGPEFPALSKRLANRIFRLSVKIRVLLADDNDLSLPKTPFALTPLNLSERRYSACKRNVRAYLLVAFFDSARISKPSRRARSRVSLD
jgi:hypothetical protein